MGSDSMPKDLPPPGGSREDELIEAALRQVAGPPPARPTPARLPETIGPYRIIRRIGAGGMGVVYEAEQPEPRRRVALKVTRSPVGVSAHHLRLFQREIDVLARLRHPSIARIYDAGHTEDGQQYFAMELIEGDPLTEYCELADLSLKDRLALFARICHAVNYAHQRGVIHRDLKPANILVDEEGVPHVLDFGLARFIDPDNEVTRSLWGDQALIGTLPYMSPEQTQAEGADLDIRTDVYSLGVIVYEMLTGQYPYQVVGRMVDVLHNIAEAEPARPSSIERQINNEVETIVLRALAKDRDRRYQSAEALAEDVRRYLEGSPIEAKRDSALYVIRKLASKHRFETSVVVALIAAVISVAAISFEFYHRELAVSRDLEQANRIIGEKYTQLQNEQQQAAAEAERAIGIYVLGWFLLEYHAGRSDQARAIMDQTAKMDSACAAAMAFLLDESYPVERLRSELPAKSTDLLQFVIGERELKGGRLSEARRAFTLCSELPGGEWLKSAARARLRELSPSPGVSAASGPC